jgi:hypothetical protein
MGLIEIECLNSRMLVRDASVLIYIAWGGLYDGRSKSSQISVPVKAGDTPDRCSLLTFHIGNV